MEAHMAEVQAGLNEAVLLGQLVAPAEFRDLPSGSEVASFSVTVRRPGHKTTSVPVSWIDPPESFRTWQVGDMVVCRGPVVRRFFRAGPSLGSATEVVVQKAALVRHKARAAKVLAVSTAEIAACVDGLDAS